MEANAGMVAGSHKRNELVRIRHDSEYGVCFFFFFYGPISILTRICFAFGIFACDLGFGSECGSPV